MAFDSQIRNKLARLVTDARNLLTDEFTKQLQEIYGIQPDGTIIPLEKLTHLTDEQMSVASVLRDRVDHLAAGLTSEKKPVIAAIDRMTREQSFTILNRFAALRMSEERGIVQECVRGRMQSKGFQVYLKVSGSGLGDQYERYKAFLFCIFDEIAVDLGILFDRFSPFGLLFPREPALQGLLEIINTAELKTIWAEDETIGWVYQYFNSVEERKAMREASQAPRNSRELAVRNQFFTPRYVVEFLTDNTLGRIWYEMRKGNTVLKEECRYLVRRPNEVFLAPGEKAPAEADGEADLSQEELLKRPVYVEYRPLKDPRDIRMLDPACGSMHFGLYAFDLFERIYDEAWELEGSLGADVFSRPEGLKPLRETYGSKGVFLRDMPRLVIEHNLHGIDIDPRAVQIAALALWLRAQKAWKGLGLKAAERPRIKKSNIVTAEPMPGEEGMRREFTESLKPRVLGQLVNVLFEKMKLAGEAGPLLKIEEEIRGGIAEAKRQWVKGPEMEQVALFPHLIKRQPKQEKLRFDVKGVTDEAFWDQAEERILTSLRGYAEQIENGRSMSRRLFAEDAALGFAFIDLCRKRYDVVLMNPPFGAAAEKAKVWMRNTYPLCAENLLISFVCRFHQVLEYEGLLGCITDRSWLQKYDYRKFRAWMISQKCLRIAVDLGWGVLDAANVETAVSVLGEAHSPTIIFGNSSGVTNHEKLKFPFVNIFFRTPEFFLSIPNYSFSYSIEKNIYSWFLKKLRLEDSFVSFQGGIASWDSFQTVRCFWEAPSGSIGLDKRWAFVQAGSPYAPFYYPTAMLTLCEEGKFRVILSNPTASTPGRELYGRPGVAFGKRTDYMYTYVMPAGGAFSWEGQAGFSCDDTTKSIFQILGFTNSGVFIGLANLIAGQHKYAGYLNTICCDVASLPDLSAQAETVVKKLVAWDQANEASSRFVSPNTLLSLDIRQFFTECTESIKAQSAEILQLHAQMSGAVEDGLGIIGVFGPPLHFDPFASIFGQEFSSNFAAAFSISYLIGTIFGRWDIRFATGERQPPELPDPFEPLPVCPPGMLIGPDGLPTQPKDVPTNYPLRISWPGVLADDENHPEDIITRVRETLEVIWPDHADAIEHEACELLGVKTLRDYFHKPAGFFQDHLKRYSKSRRKAPIYWPLSTSSGAYTLWIYYHRLTDQTLFMSVQDFVEPKIKEVERDIERMQKEIEKGKKAIRDEVDRLMDFRQELIDFRDELLRVAKLPYKPNLNDGVMVTACPLWKLFKHNAWSRDLRECWEKLEAGDYDWAHLAYSIWPERVRDVCKRDRSIAIAHGLEDLYQGEIPIKRPKGKRKK